MDGLSDVAAGTAPVMRRSAGATAIAQRLTGLRLPPTQRRVIRYVAAHPHEAALLSSTDLAERIGVSQATITRVAVALGFSGFTEMRNEFRQLLYADADEVDGEGSEPTVGEAQAAVLRSIENLQVLYELLDDPLPVQQAGVLLAASQPLPILATRISEPLGRYLGYRLRRCHPDVRLVERGDSIGADRLTMAAYAGATALLCVNLPRYAAETLELLQLAVELELRIVMITDAVTAVGSHLAEHTFGVPVGTGLMFDSHAAPTVLASVLVDAVSDARGAAGQGHLDVLDALADRRRTFVE